MTLPANIRVNIGAPFPAMVKASAPASISKQNGIWTVGLNFTGLVKNAINPDPVNTYTLVWNALTGVFSLVLASSLSIPSSAPTPVAFAQSPYVVLPTDAVLYVDSSGGAVTINLPAAAARLNRPLIVKDVAGGAAVAGHNITIVPNGAETIEGLANLVIVANYGGFSLSPATAKYVITP